jgi:hypothetical protein
LGPADIISHRVSNGTALYHWYARFVDFRHPTCIRLVGEWLCFGNYSYCVRPDRSYLWDIFYFRLCHRRLSGGNFQLATNEQSLKVKASIIEIKVECYAGYRGEETPRIIRFESRKIEVKKLLDCWLDPDYRYFKILGDDDGIYIIRHDTKTWVWGLTFYQELRHK